MIHVCLGSEGLEASELVSEVGQCRGELRQVCNGAVLQYYAAARLQSIFGAQWRQRFDTLWLTAGVGRRGARDH